MRLNKTHWALPAVAVAVGFFASAAQAQGQGSGAQGASSATRPQTAVLEKNAPTPERRHALVRRKRKYVPEGEARIAALKAVAGIVKKSELEKKRGAAVYKFRIKAESDGVLRKIKVDARTGALLSVKKAN